MHPRRSRPVKYVPYSTATLCYSLGPALLAADSKLRCCCFSFFPFIFENSYDVWFGSILLRESRAPRETRKRNTLVFSTVVFASYRCLPPLSLALSLSLHHYRASEPASSVFNRSINIFRCVIFNLSYTRGIENARSWRVPRRSRWGFDLGCRQQHPERVSPDPT